MSKTIKIKHNKSKIVNKRKNTYKVKSKSGKKSKNFTRRVGGYGNKKGQKSKKYIERQRKLNQKNNPRKETDIPSNEAVMGDSSYLNDRTKDPLFYEEGNNDINKIHSVGPNQPVIPSRNPVPLHTTRQSVEQHPLVNNPQKATPRNKLFTTSPYEDDSINQKIHQEDPNERVIQSDHPINTSRLPRQLIEKNDKPLLQDHGEVVNIDEHQNNSSIPISGSSKPMTASKPVTAQLVEAKSAPNSGSTIIDGSWGNAADADDSGVLPGLKPSTHSSNTYNSISIDERTSTPSFMDVGNNDTPLDLENELGKVPLNNNDQSLNTLYPQYDINQPVLKPYPKIPDIQHGPTPVNEGSVLNTSTARKTARNTLRPKNDDMDRSRTRFTSVDDNFNGVDIPIRSTVQSTATPIRSTQLPIDIDIDRNTSLDSKKEIPIPSPTPRSTPVDVRTDIAAGINSNPPNNKNLTEESNQCEMSSSLNTLFDKGTGIYLNILNKMAEDEKDPIKIQQINELIDNLKSVSSDMNDTLKTFIEKLKTIYPDCDYNSSPSNTKIENILKVDAGTAIGSALMAIMLLGGKKKKTRGKKYRVSKKKSRRSTKK
jgi:hypothetical protein